jgi:hypothetical protein
MAAPPTTATTPSYAKTKTKSSKPVLPKATDKGAAAKKLSERQKERQKNKEDREKKREDRVPFHEREGFDRDQHVSDTSSAFSALTGSYTPSKDVSKKPKKTESDEDTTPGQPSLVEMATAMKLQKDIRDRKAKEKA